MVKKSGAVISILILLLVIPKTIVADDALRYKLENFVAEMNARIGVGVIWEGQDTTILGCDEAFPMLSVYKFPQAIAVAEYCQQAKRCLDDTISILASQIKTDTYSPMREKYGVRDLRLPLSELLAYSLRESDNNACDILFDLIGGPYYADSIMTSMGFKDIHIRSTEDEMHKDVMACYRNCSSPAAMCSLLVLFTDSLSERGDIYPYIAGLMEGCVTGMDRLPSPISDRRIRLGHKTGTGDRNPQGKIIGVNDVGYFILPDGRKYVISVFIADSGYSLEETSGLIGEISRIVMEHFIQNK